MLKRNFLNNIKRGLGRAYLELKNAENREEYRETLLYACLHDCAYFFVSEGSKGAYLFNLINLIDNNNYFKQKIKDFLQTSLPKRDLFAQLMDIFKCYHLEGDKEIKL